ncbi:hypothetical protein [Novosphingobium sp. AP12]|uniref:hypothetical protein n=1 Tax=Novosphingobium sp. AP12 TaxID=1144305 RepID=UPI000271DDFA|nr:hypothetical protein [Novosphingobium sp. AP12]EJL21892.1 hypothetical protein PMI02_04877 [Novosphingobium sp. AP12]
MKAQGLEPVLPLNPLPYLSDWLFEIGPSAPAGMGDAAIDFRHMAAWTRIMGVDLTPWEARTLRRLSRAYVNQREDARKPACIEPRLKADQVAAQKRVDDQFTAMVKAFAARKKV